MKKPPHEIYITICRICNRQDPPNADLGVGLPRRVITTICPNCRRRQWHRLCPAAFLDTDEKRLPRPDLFAEVMQWRFRPRGLLLHGPTDTGKSRTAWKLAEREFLSGRSVAAVTSFSLGVDLPAQFSESPAAAKKLITRWLEPDILLLDDCFKARLSERVEETIFELVDYRTSNGLPLLVTTNDTGESIVSRISADRGPALVRRLREFCQRIAFEATQPVRS